MPPHFTCNNCGHPNSGNQSKSRSEKWMKQTEIQPFKWLAFMLELYSVSEAGCDCRYLQITLISDFFQCESYRGHLKEELWRRRAKWPGFRNCVGCSRRRVKNQFWCSTINIIKHSCLRKVMGTSVWEDARAREFERNQQNYLWTFNFFLSDMSSRYSRPTNMARF